MTSIDANASSGLMDLVYGPSTSPWDSDLVGIKGHYIKGEVLETMLPLRSGLTELHDYDLGYADDETDFTGTQLHSMASLVMVLYAALEVAEDDWKEGAAKIWAALYDDDLARGTIGEKASGALMTRDGNGDASNVMRQAIAYSAIEEGAQPFGDTAIEVLFNNANEFGVALGEAAGSSAFAAHADSVAKVIVQFAAQLALQEIMVSSAVGTAAIGGTDAFSYDGNANAVTIDFSEELWEMGAAELPAMPGRFSPFFHLHS